MVGEMNRMQAPWRIDYIKAAKEEGCVLCQALQRGNDRESLILQRNELAFVIMNKYPYTNGHLMVAPNEHLGDMTEVRPEVWREVMVLSQLCVRALDEVAQPHGYNLGINVGRVAGAGVLGHLHLHVVPRWNGDVNFMPVLAEVRVINQHIEEMYEDLARAFARLKNSPE